MRKLLSMILAILMTLSIPMAAYAAETPAIEDEECLLSKEHDGEEYFRFTGGKERIDENGNFEFYCNSYMDSGEFIAGSNKITLKASAKMYNRNTGRHSTSSTREFTITVHKVGGSALTPVLTGKLDGKSVSTTVYVEKGETYYLTIRSSSTLDPVIYMDGAGSVTPVG